MLFEFFVFIDFPVSDGSTGIIVEFFLEFFGHKFEDFLRSIFEVLFEIGDHFCFYFGHDLLGEDLFETRVAFFEIICFFSDFFHFFVCKGIESGPRVKGQVLKGFENFIIKFSIFEPDYFFDENVSLLGHEIVD